MILMTPARSLAFDDFTALYPDAVSALRLLGSVSGEGLDKRLLELVKVRASQLNGCAYCVQLHCNWARKAGVPQSALDRLAAWHDSPDFDARERAALAWTETLTRIGNHQELEAARIEVLGILGHPQYVRLTIAIATINAWNRIAAPLGFPPVASA
jgi:AhpD family alkylhydroperoxidase